MGSYTGMKWGTRSPKSTFEGTMAPGPPRYAYGLNIVSKLQVGK